MPQPLMHFAATTPAPADALSDEMYVRAALEEFLANPGFRPLETQRPARALPASEIAALAAVGWVEDEGTRRDAELARREALDVFFRMFSTALPTAEVASMLGVNPSRIRQRVKERTLLPLTKGSDQRFPAAWFEGTNEVPGLRQVLAAIPPDYRPIEALSWWLTPTPDLTIDGTLPAAPRAYLLATGDTDRVVALAAGLTRGEAA